MSPDFSPELQRELLEDFFSEADEHLVEIRRDLLSLEEAIGGQPKVELIERLFRNFHSFKGISAIAGLREAEELAHAAEEFFRDFTKGGAVLTGEGWDLLMKSGQRLEQVTGAFRLQKEIPEIGDLVTELQRGGANKGASTPAMIAEAKAPVGVQWKFIFKPSHELDARGVNLNSVRERLSKCGEIVKSTPIIKEGNISFEFLVALKEAPDIEAWEKDGVQAELAAEPAAQARVEVAEHNPFIAPSQVVRVDLPRLDDLMRIVGEMVIKRSRFEEEIARLSRTGVQLDLRSLQEINTGFARSLRELRQGVMHVRMVPVAEIFARMPFVVRDLARENSKKARLELVGERTEIDKYLIEQLKDPLLHLVRNAFSHGVESPEERRKAGKAEEAVITLTAATSGDLVVITVADDGRGVDREAVLKRAAEMGLGDAELVDILCAPGFSTRADADRAAGRGVGMAVVKKTISDLGGMLSLESAPGNGTKFILRLPLTLVIADTIIVSAANQTCAVPQSYISEVVQVEEEEIQRVNGVEVIPYRDGVLPVVRLDAFFKLPKSGRPQSCVLVLNSDRGSSGLLVDRIHGQKEVVVRAIRDPLIQTPGVTGATELGDGRPVLILDGAAFTAGAIRPHLPAANN